MTKTIFEEMGGTYTQVGDYLLPDLKLPEEEQLIGEEPPKIFWKYYDLYRRKRISLNEYVAATDLSAFEIRHFLKNIVEKTT